MEFLNPQDFLDEADRVLDDADEYVPQPLTDSGMVRMVRELAPRAGVSVEQALRTFGFTSDV